MSRPGGYPDKRPEVHFQMRGESGNTLYILMLVRDVLRKQRRFEDFNSLRDNVMSSHSQEEALRHMCRYVKLIDDDGVWKE